MVALKIDWDEWREVTPKEVGVYLSDKKDSMNASEFDDAETIRFNYETGVEHKDKHDYFAKEPLPKIMREKRNPIYSAGRGAWNGALELPKGIWNAALGVAEWGLVHGATPEQAERYKNAANALRAKNEAFFTELGYLQDKKDNKIAFDLGQGTTSLAASVGLTIVTKNPAAAAGLFGVNQYGNTNSELRQKGVDVDKANGVALAQGLTEAGLEGFGLHYFVENMATKTMGKYLLKQGLTEAVQETSQTYAEEELMVLGGMFIDEKISRGKSQKQIAGEAAYSGALGGVLGIAGGGAAAPFKSRMVKTAKEKLVAGGVNEQEAAELAEGGIYGNEKQAEALRDKLNEVGFPLATADEIREETIKMLNREADFDTFEGSTPEAEAKRFNDEIQKASAADAAAEAFDIKEDILEQAKEAGLPEDEALFVATHYANFALQQYNEGGETPREWYEAAPIKLIDERVQNTPAREITAEEAAELEDAEVVDESELSAEQAQALAEAEKNLNADNDLSQEETPAEQSTDEDLDALFDLSDETFYQFAGEKAQTAALDELDKARQFEADGVDNEQIRQQTGWFKGADGKWRFEIPDGNIREDFNVDKYRKFDDDFSYVLAPLEAFYDNEKLYQAYPQLRKLPVQFSNYLGAGTEGISFGGTISLSAGYLSKDNPEFVKQKERLENTKEYKEYEAAYESEPVNNDYEGWHKKVDEATDKFFKTDVGKEYHELMWGKNYKIERTVEGLSKNVKSALIHEIQHEIQKIEGFARGGNPDKFASMEELRRGLEDAKTRLKEADEALETAEDLGYSDETLVNGDKTVAFYKEQKERAQSEIDYIEDKIANYKEPFEAYRSLAGEVEARNTQARMNMSDEERAATSPESTQDIKNADAIVVFDDGTAMAYKPDIQKREDIVLQRADGKKIQVQYYPQNKRNIVPFDILNHKLGDIVTKKTKKDIQKAILGDKEKIYAHNELTGINAVVTKNDIDEMISNVFSGNDKGYIGIKKEIVANVDNIFKQAVPILKHAELKNKNLYDTQTIHRFALPVKIGNLDFLVMITVKERLDANEAKIDEFSIYSLQSEKRNAADSPSKSDENASQSHNQPHIYNISELKEFVNKNLKKYKPNDIQTFYQSAFHGTPHPELEGGHFSLEKVGSGEGRAAHGYGAVYAALKYDVAEDYRKRLSEGKSKLVIGNKSVEDWINSYDWNNEDMNIPDNLVYDIKRYIENSGVLRKRDTTEAKSIVMMNLGYYIQDLKTDLQKEDVDEVYLKHTQEDLDNLNDLRDKLATYTWQEYSLDAQTGQTYEVDIPENPYLMDEDEEFVRQPEIVRNALREIVNELTDEQISKEFAGTTYPENRDALRRMWEDGDYDFNNDGRGIYRSLTTMLGSKKAASQMLEKHGVKGITYEGAQDGRCFVIFNPKDVKVIQKFYQQEANDNQRKPKASYQYTPRAKIIHLFKNADHSSVVHELGHLFTIDYVNLLERLGKQEKLRGFYDWLGIKNINEATHETWEKMARGFETYVMEGTAPNVETENLFIRFKNYLLDVYRDISGKIFKPEEINDDVREFFDKMLASDEQIPDISNLQGKIEEVRDIVKGALRGEEMNVEGLSVKDLRDLVKILTRRRPRMPKTLEQKIRAAGGIDIELAKQIGIYDEKKGNRSGFFRKNGTLSREDSIMDFLADNGYMATSESNTYEEKAALWDEALKLLERADKQFNAEEQSILEQREQVESFAFEAMQTLGDIKTDDIFKAISVLNKNNAVGVKKETLQYLNARLKSIESAYKQVKKDIKALKNDIADKQAKLVDYVKKLPITGDDKVKIMERIKRAKLADDFDEIIEKVNTLGKDFYEHEQKKILASMIDKEIKKSRPKQITKQKYDYENNKLFADLRAYNKMTQAEAAEMLEKTDIKEDMTPEELARVRFLEYKANGMKASPELMKEVYADLTTAKSVGEQAKSEDEFIKRINREDLKQQVMAAIDKNTADKNKIRTQITNLYRGGLANLYSLLNSVTSKKIARQFEMETVLNEAQEKFHVQTEAVADLAERVYGLTSKGDFLNKLAELGKITDKLYNNDNVKVEEISKIKIIDMYNAVKNAKTRQDYYKHYGEEQVNRLLSQLNDKDREFGDLLMHDINKLFPEVNRTYVSIYGIDLPKVDNYWPATSEHTSDTSLLGDYNAQSNTPSSWKERVKGTVTPVPQNAWSKYLKHVNENIYMINTAVKYKQLADTFKSQRVKNKLKLKYGDKTYVELMTAIEDLSLKAKKQSLSSIETAMGSFINNMVGAKIALAPSVFLGQLTSITNYAENVNTATFYKHFIAGLTHPKETIKFMESVAKDFLEARYKGGYAEDISRVLHEAQDAANQKYRLFSPKAKYNLTNVLSSFVRLGDIGAIIFGGYGHIKANIEAGMSMQEAVKEFKFDTLRSQQSSNAASLSSWQKNRGALARMFLAFKNTPHQYFRKLVDATINLQRGEITLKQYSKIVMNYALMQPVLYVMAKNLWKAALDLFDDDDENSIFDGVIEQVLVGTFDAIPILNDIMHQVYRQATGQYSGNSANLIGYDDISKSIRKFAKDDKDVYDWIEIISPLIEGLTGAPLQRYERILKKYEG